MDERDILSRIGEFVEEEHRLREMHENGRLTRQEEQQRLRQLEVALDQCWDLLRQRRARARAGEDPDRAHTRPADEVERYLQ
ncbi:DUF2630 family protein [Thermomonospora cellulosilytica]|uniref:DUF2630 family protein n=1 Tax=Thermomonospora cellulosilytica TaxID=1411118 RepID=A0A7W3R8B9_9ACTN|nr:DUF2630 family protein [Thermomonospora cellulosilytica]MBA9003404.1 hypothetical protein [Thermomonospora cellulosilytica]